MDTSPPRTSPLRVLYLGHVARLSGGELALARLIAALGDRVEPVVVLAETGPLVGLLQSQGVDVRVLPLDESVREVRRNAVGGALRAPVQVLSLMRYISRLVRLIRAVKPDLVHTNTLKAGVYGSIAARIARVPCLWHVRDRLASDYLPARTATVMREMVRRLPDLVVANSHATLATLRPSRVPHVVIGEVVEAPAARPVRDDDVFRIGIVGRLSAWKGHDVFLHAVARAFGEDSAVRATIVGAPLFDGDDTEPELRALAAELGLAKRVEWRGFRDDIGEEMQRLDVLIHASTVPEPFGQVVIEGLAAGVPVAATSEGGPAEIITDGVDGLLYPAGDAVALAAHLARLHTDTTLREKLIAAGRRRAADFSPATISGQMFQAYARMT